MLLYLHKSKSSSPRAQRRLKSLRRLFGLRLEVVEVPLLKIEAAVDRDGKMAAVRCRAALDLGIEVVFEGVAPGYRLEKTAGAEAATSAEAVVERRDEVERLLEEGVLRPAGVRRR